MNFRNEFRQLLNRLSIDRLRDRGALNTGYSLEELEEELDRRESMIQRVEKRTDKFHKRKKNYLEKAANSKNQRQLRFVAKAKEAEMNKSFYAELFDNWMAQQLFLTKLVLEAKRRRIADNAQQEFGFNVDIAGMDVQGISQALESSGIEDDEMESTIENLQMELELHDDTSSLMPDLDDLKQEADMLSASDIDESFELGGGWSDKLTEEIEKELDGMDDEFNGDPTDDK